MRLSTARMLSAGWGAMLLTMILVTSASAGSVGDDVQRYAGLNVHMASGSIDFASHSPGVMVLDAPTDGGNWAVKEVSLGEDALTTTANGFVRVACWYQDAQDQHPFASFRIAAGATPADPFAPPYQLPSWLGESLQGQVWCGAEEIGAQITSGMMWFRFYYKEMTP